MIKPEAVTELVVVVCVPCMIRGRYVMDLDKEYLERHFKEEHPELISPDEEANDENTNS